MASPRSGGLRALLPRRTKCRGWIPLPEKDSHPFFHDPGDCRQCWRPCHADRRAGTAFCDDCWERYATHSALKIRLATLSRHDIPLEWLHFMADDMEATVADAAEERLESFAQDESLDEDDPFGGMYAASSSGASKER